MATIYTKTMTDNMTKEDLAQALVQMESLKNIEKSRVEHLESHVERIESYYENKLDYEAEKTRNVIKNKLSVETLLIDALDETEKCWRANPEGDYKHIRRDIIGALNELGYEISYRFNAKK
jgi:hypothetical protein